MACVGLTDAARAAAAADSAANISPEMRLTAEANRGRGVARECARDARSAETGVLTTQPAMQPTNDGRAPSMKKDISTSPDLEPRARRVPICTVLAPTASQEMAIVAMA